VQMKEKKCIQNFDVETCVEYGHLEDRKSGRTLSWVLGMYRVVQK
jgi:hypothetical protein